MDVSQESPNGVVILHWDILTMSVSASNLRMVSTKPGVEQMRLDESKT